MNDLALSPRHPQPLTRSNAEEYYECDYGGLGKRPFQREKQRMPSGMASSVVICSDTGGYYGCDYGGSGEDLLQ